MRVGFTGTQRGMTVPQKLTVAKMLLEYERVFGSIWYHHGDCIGADEDFQLIVRTFLREPRIVVHPPLDPKKRAFCEGDTILSAQEYLVRNKQIVGMTDVIIATPWGTKEQRRSGTWSTMRYAKKLGKDVMVVWPGGTNERWEG